MDHRDQDPKAVNSRNVAYDSNETFARPGLEKLATGRPSHKATLAAGMQTMISALAWQLQQPF